MELLKISTRKNSLALTAIVGVALVLGACQSMGGGEKEMAKPINCSTAKPDIATLQKERASVLREMGAGVQTFVPIGAVIGLFQGKGPEALNGPGAFPGIQERRAPPGNPYTHILQILKWDII